MSSPRTGYTRSQWYAGQKLEVGRDNLLSTVDDKLHTKKRAVMAMGVRADTTFVVLYKKLTLLQYSGKDVEGVEATLDKYVLGFLDLIRKRYVSTEEEPRQLDLARRVSFFVMDFTTDIAFGRPWGCLDRDEDVDKWFESAAIVLPIVIMVATIPWLATLFSIPIIGRMVGPSDKDRTGPGKILAYGSITRLLSTISLIIVSRAVKETVRQRFELEDHEQKKDMMGSFIRHGISKDDVVAEAALQM